MKEISKKNIWAKRERGYSDRQQGVAHKKKTKERKPKV